MRDRNAFVTRDVTGESQHPVPALPDPSRPALYIDRGDFTSWRSVSDASRRDAMMSSTLTGPAGVTRLDTIEGIDLDAEVPCMGMHPDDECPNPADLIVTTHIVRLSYPVCSQCWSAAGRGRCPDTDAIETRDEHFRIVEVLR